MYALKLKRSTHVRVEFVRALQKNIFAANKSAGFCPPTPFSPKTLLIRAISRPLSLFARLIVYIKSPPAPLTAQKK